MDCCENCKYFDLHPFIREGDWTCYCTAKDTTADPNDFPCEEFEEIEY